jgi:putative transposase
VSATPEARRGWIQAEPHALSIVQQCALAGLARSTYYYEPVPARDENLELMRRIDTLYLPRPFYGVPRMTDWLQALGHAATHKRVERLMRVMGLQAVLPGPPTSRPQPAHQRYPYLLRTLEVVKANQVWCADITYVPMRRGFLYLVAVMDWFQPLRVGLGSWATPWTSAFVSRRWDGP